MTTAPKKTSRPLPLHQHSARKSSRSPLLLNLSDLEALPDNDWIRGLFMRSQVSAIVGDKSTGKTSIATALATMQAYGDPWHDGTAATPGAVLYVVAEGLAGMGNRRAGPIPHPARKRLSVTSPSNAKRVSTRWMMITHPAR